MNDAEISDLVANLPADLAEEFGIQYQAPVALGRSHSINLENQAYVGTISIWASGAMDWHIFDIVTSTESALGYHEVNEINAARNTLLTIFGELRAYGEARC